MAGSDKPKLMPRISEDNPEELDDLLLSLSAAASVQTPASSLQHPRDL